MPPIGTIQSRLLQFLAGYVCCEYRHGSHNPPFADNSPELARVKRLLVGGVAMLRLSDAPVVS
jgi:hypothetical protein